MSKFEELKTLCKGHCPDILKTVILGVEESIDECEGEFHSDLTALVLVSIKNDSLQSELSENLDYFSIREDDNLEQIVECINEGAIFGKVPSSSGLTDESNLLDLVIYSLKVSL